MLIILAIFIGILAVFILNPGFYKWNNQFALVLEDDISFNPNLFRNILNKSLRISELWDVVFFDIYHGGLPIKIITRYYLNYYLNYY